MCSNNITRCKHQRHGETLMNDLELLQIPGEQLNRQSAKHFVYKLIERLAHWQNNQNSAEVYDGCCGARYAQSFLFARRGKKVESNGSQFRTPAREAMCTHSVNKHCSRPTPSIFRR